MKKLIPFLFIYLFILSILYSQSFHSITIDGNNDFTGSETFQTSTTGYVAYLTWDKDFIYLGYVGTDIGFGGESSNKWLVFYFDTDPNENPISGNGTSSAIGFNTQNYTLPFNADYMLQVRSDEQLNSLNFYDGSSWNSISNSIEIYDNDAANFIEIRIPKSNLGNPKQIFFLSFFLNETPNFEFTYGIAPNNSLADGYHSSGIFTKYFSFYLLDQFNPNASFNQNNFSWLIKLTASTSSLSDTNIFAGMSVNATDGFDSGIDIAKPPAPASNYIDVYFDQPSWTTSNLGSRYSRDIKKLISLDSTTTYWNFNVNTDQSNSTVTLTAKDFDFVPSNYDITLHDFTADSTHNIKSNGNYEYNSGSRSVRQFRLTVGYISTPPEILVSTNTLDFGSILLGSDSTKSFTIENIGIETLLISNITTSNSSFTINGSTELSIPNNGSSEVSVTFSPNSAVTYLDTLTIVSNDPDFPNYNVILNGTGVPLTPNISSNINALDFGLVRVDYDSTITVKLYNTGTGSLSISGITSSSNNFTISGTTSFNISVNDSASRDITFSPNSIQGYTDTLFIASNDPDTPILRIELAGEGSTSIHHKIFNSGWNLISFPVNPDDRFIGQVIGDDISNYLFYNYSSSGGYTSEDSISLGRGYWLGLQSSDTIDIEGTPLVDSTSINLIEGWNLVASPFIRAYPISKVYFRKGTNIYSSSAAIDSGWISNAYYRYNNDSSNYSIATTLSQWSGYWFLSAVSNISAVFFPDSTVGNPLREEKKKDFRIDINNWYVDIKSEFSNSSDNLLRFGTNINATDNIELNYDLPKPPQSPSSNSVYSYFRIENSLQPINLFAYDLRAPYTDNSVGKSWTFYVSTKGSGQVTISWKSILETIPQEILSKYSFYLTGFGILNKIDMETTKQFSFNSSANENYEFQINSIVTSIEDESVPYKFTLDQNYPNPFNPLTTISYEVPEDGFVSLIVYDLLGNEIQQLIYENQKAGRYNVQFNAVNISTGVYFYKLAVNDKKAVKKMILLK